VVSSNNITTVVDREKPVVDSRDEGKHTGRNDLLSVEKTTQDGRASVTKDEGYNRLRGAQQQTRRTLLQRSIDGTDRQTDTGPICRPCRRVTCRLAAKVLPARRYASAGTSYGPVSVWF